MSGKRRLYDNLANKTFPHLSVKKERKQVKDSPKGLSRAKSRNNHKIVDIESKRLKKKERKKERNVISVN